MKQEEFQTAEIMVISQAKTGDLAAFSNIGEIVDALEPRYGG